MKIRFNTRCNTCERPAWRRQGQGMFYGRHFICSRCLSDLIDSHEVKLAWS